MYTLGKKERLKDLSSLFLSITLPLLILFFILQNNLSLEKLFAITTILCLIFKLNYKEKSEIIDIKCKLLLKFTLSPTILVIFGATIITFLEMDLKNEVLKVMELIFQLTNTFLFLRVQIKRYIYYKVNQIKETYRMLLKV